MSTLGKIHTGIGLALVAALTFVAGYASADADEMPPQPAGLRCTVSSGTSVTGREWARLVILREHHGEVICSRVRIGGDAPSDFPSCHARKDELGCTIIVD